MAEKLVVGLGKYLWLLLRILEEILRLLRSGTAMGAFKKLRSCSALEPIFPGLHRHLDPGRRTADSEAVRQSFWRLLEALDADIQSGELPSNAVLVALLIHDLVEARASIEAEELQGAAIRNIANAADSILEPFTSGARLPRKDASKARRLLTLQGRFTAQGKQGFRPLLFCLTEDFQDALALFRIRSRAKGRGYDIYQGWVDRLMQANELTDEEILEERRHGRRRKRKRRRRKKRS